jgi:subtilase family serine protease
VRHSLKAAASVTAAALAVGSLAGLAATAGATSSARPAVEESVLQGASLMRPNVSSLPAKPPTNAYCKKHYDENCYSPLQIQTAYNLGPLYSRGNTGKGRTIVIVDSFGSPTIRSDLATFDKQYGIPAPPSLTIIQPAGKVAPYNPKNSGDVGWAEETTLDVEYSHTVAPGAKILLVETPVNETIGVHGFPQIVEAENYVIDHNLGDVISQSFGTSEISFSNPDKILSLRSDYVNAQKHDVTVLAASGDSGSTQPSNDAETTYYTVRNVGWPSSDPLVTSVGGTKLHLNAAGHRTAPDTVWNDQSLFHSPAASSGGYSVVFKRPSYQDSVKSVVGEWRGQPDISMSASCSGAVLIYTSFGGAAKGWGPICGTSEASPLFAGIVALADQYAGKRLGLINPTLYRLEAEHAPGIVDITSGNNTVSFKQHGKGKTYTVPGFSASKKYNLATGVGTINAALFVPELAGKG